MIMGSPPPGSNPGSQAHHLLGSHDDCLDAELAPAHIEQVFKGRTEEVDHQYVVQTLLAEVVHLGHTG